MNADMYIQQGTAHSICEDYALCGKTNDVYYVIGADGCSSSDGTDVGSRLLCYSAKKAIEQVCRQYNYATLELSALELLLKQSIIEDLKQMQHLLAVPASMFDATLLITISNGSRHLAYAFGDGAVILRYANSMRIISLEYSANAPCYLSYAMDENSRSCYASHFGEKPLLVTEYEIPGGGLPEKKCHELSALVHYSKEIITPGNNPLLSITMCSDGIQSYYTADNEKCTVESLAQEYTNYKSYVGEFVKRKMNKLTREHAKAGISHYDDIFCGTISFS